MRAVVNQASALQILTYEMEICDTIGLTDYIYLTIHLYYEGAYKKTIR